MPVVLTNPTFPFQVGASPTTQSFSTQSNFRQMIGEVTQFNPNLDPEVAGRFLNNRYRKIVDRRSWYGLKVRGVASVPNVIQSGQATVTNGSANVTGTNTGWTTALVGLQFRTAFIYPYQTITAVNAGTQTLTLDTPFQGTTATGGYQILQVYITFGANIKRLEWATNNLFGWPMEINVPVKTLNQRDTWRQNLGWARVLATRAPTPDGQFQVECWPSPYAQQDFAFEAWTQPPNMDADTDAPVAWIRSDLLVKGASSDALLHRPKSNPYYSEQAAIEISGRFSQEFEQSLREAEDADESLDQQAVSWDYGDEDGGNGNGYGSAFAQMHE